MSAVCPRHVRARIRVRGLKNFDVRVRVRVRGLKICDVRVRVRGFQIFDVRGFKIFHVRVHVRVRGQGVTHMSADTSVRVHRSLAAINKISGFVS